VITNEPLELSMWNFVWRHHKYIYKFSMKHCLHNNHYKRGNGAELWGYIHLANLK